MYDRERLMNNLIGRSFKWRRLEGWMRNFSKQENNFCMVWSFYFYFMWFWGYWFFMMASNNSCCIRMAGKSKLEKASSDLKVTYGLLEFSQNMVIFSFYNVLSIMFWLSHCILISFRQFGDIYSFLFDCICVQLEKHRVEQLEKSYPNWICTQSLGYVSHLLFLCRFALPVSFSRNFSSFFFILTWYGSMKIRNFNVSLMLYLDYDCRWR